MDVLSGTWAVVYDDDTIVTQKDEQHPDYSPDAKEVPFKAIDWSRVQRVLFHSLADVTEFKMTPTPEWNVAMRSRVFMDKFGHGIRTFLITIGKPGLEPDPESTERVLYWFPTGITHDCPYFNCPDVAQYGLTYAHNLPGSLTPTHEVTTTGVDAELN